MKKLEIIIKPEKLEDLKALLDSEEVNGLNIVNSMGYGNQKGIIKNYRGAEYAVNLLPKIKVETVVTDEVAPKLIDKIVEQINTGHIGDGKIFMYEVEDAIRIRTGEHGVDALRVNKITQESPNVMDLILGHKIDLVIDTPTQGNGDKNRDGFLIRRNAIETGVYCITAMDTANALATSLENAQSELTLVDIATVKNI